MAFQKQISGLGVLKTYESLETLTSKVFTITILSLITRVKKKIGSVNFVMTTRQFDSPFKRA
jgi:hypothetical protein